MKFSLRLLYLYLFSFVGLLVTVIGSIQTVNLGLKVFIFKDADRYDYIVPVIPETQCIDGTCVGPDSAEMKRNSEVELKRQRQREFASSLSMILVGMPLYLYHWGVIKKEKKD